MVIAVVASVLFIQEYFKCRIDQNVIRLRGFYQEDEDSLDVVLLGASDVYSGYVPAEAYRSVGYTSYAYAFQNNPVILWKYELREILKSQHPKVLIIEPNGATRDSDKYEIPASLYYVTKNMHISANKIELIDAYGGDDKLIYYLPFVKYHGMWGDAGKYDLISLDLRGYNMLRGAFSHKYISDDTAESTDYTRDGSVEPLDPVSEQALTEFLDECDASGIEHIVFVRFPRKIINQRLYRQYGRYNAIRDIVEVRGYEYIDFDTDDAKQDAGIDLNRDYFNADHMLARGQKKFTVYFAKYMADKYDIHNTRMDADQRAEWDRSVEYTDLYYEAFEEDIAEAQKRRNKNDNLRDGMRTMKRLDKLKADARP